MYQFRTHYQLCTEEIMSSRDEKQSAINNYYLSLSLLQNKKDKLNRFNYLLHLPSPARIKLTVQKANREYQLEQNERRIKWE